MGLLFSCIQLVRKPSKHGVVRWMTAVTSSSTCDSCPTRTNRQMDGKYGKTGASTPPPLQAHEMDPCICETPAKMFEVPSGHRLFQTRVGAADVAAQASQLTNCPGSVTDVSCPPVSIYPNLFPRVDMNEIFEPLRGTWIAHDIEVAEGQRNYIRK